LEQLGAALDSAPGQPRAQPGAAPAHSSVTRPLKGQGGLSLLSPPHLPPPRPALGFLLSPLPQPSSPPQPPLPTSLPFITSVQLHSLPTPPPDKVVLAALLCWVWARRTMSSHSGTPSLFPPLDFSYCSIFLRNQGF
jgi:hypothetical protein